MSKKTNALNLRSLKNKEWSLKSFFEDFNYSKVLYQDFYIKDYIQGVLERHYYESIIHDIVIQRRKDIIRINIFFYSHKPINFGLGKKNDLNKFSVRLKKKYWWKLKKKYYSYYFQLIRQSKLDLKPLTRFQIDLKRISDDKKREQGVFVEPEGYQKTRVFFFDKVESPFQFKKGTLHLFSLKKLIILNLQFLTGCRVAVHFTNMALSSNFLINPKRDQRSMHNRLLKKFTPNKFNNVRGVMGILKIRPRVNKLVGINVPYLVHLIFTSFIYKSPKILGVIINRYLKKNIKSFNFFFNFLSRTLLPIYSFSSLKGLKIQFKGRLGTSLRKRTSTILFGSMPLQTINSNIKYSFTESITIYGICGIKIWYHY